mgnify:CR=1 FL=1
MMSSVAGLTEGVIGGGTYLPCTGEFDKITPSPKCWIYPSAHGSLNVVGAIQHSCNDFFYEVGYRLGQDSNGNYDSDTGLEKLAKYAKMFGFVLIGYLIVMVFDFQRIKKIPMDQALKNVE